MKSENNFAANLPQHAMSGTDLDELELLAGGLFAPANGYCLPQQVPEGWPVPFLLRVPSSVAQEALKNQAILLTDPDGTPLARLDVTRISAHAEPPTRDTRYLAGSLSVLRWAEHPPARSIRLTEPLAQSSDGKRTVLAVFSETPRNSQVALAIESAHQENAVLWIVAECGPQPHGRYTVQALLDELSQIVDNVDGARLGMIVLPSNRTDPHRGRILHDHLLQTLSADRVLDFSTVSATVNTWTPDASLPSRPTRRDGAAQTGLVVFLTGLSGSGKSTVARALSERLVLDAPQPVTLLDGDDVRRTLSPGLGFTREERETNVRRLGWVASLIAGAGGIVICAPIAPFDTTRQEVREMAEAVGDFLLVHVSTALSVCESRDRKGLYARARKGELKDFTGIDSAYEIPADADLQIDTGVISTSEAVESILLAVAIHSKSDSGEFSRP